MALDYIGFSLSMAARNVCYGFGNVLFNGFESDIKEKDLHKKIPITLQHFNPLTTWEIKDGWKFDCRTKDRYDYDSNWTLRAKCTALFLSTIFLQTVGLLLNLINRIAKLVVFSHLWVSSPNEYTFKARLKDMGKDLLRVVATPLILFGLIITSIYGIFRPQDGAKLYATFERIAYAGGYHRFCIRYDDDVQNSFVGLCFQPEPVAHLFGTKMGEPGW